MKRGKTRVQTTPVPTDNPKPHPAQRPASSAKHLRARALTEPIPQPSFSIRRKRRGLRVVAFGIEPQPQPMPAKLLKTSPLPGPILKSAAVRKNSRVTKNTVAAIQTEAAPETSAPAPVLKAAGVPPSPAPASTTHSPARPRSARQPRPVPVEIPPILLEPDHVPSAEPAITGPGARFVIAPSQEPAHVVIPTELPESYGTKQVFLVARDPYWLLASWDLDRAQQERFNKQSASGALTVRLRKGDADGPIHLEVHTQARSKDWFIYAGAPDTTFVAELGFHQKDSGEWRQISVSKPVTTPRDRIAPAPALQPPQPPATTPVAIVPEVPRRGPEIVFATPAPQTESPWIPRDPWPEIAPSAARVETPMHVEPRRRFESPRFEILPETPRQFVAPTTRRWRPSPPPAWTAAQARALDELISFELKRTQQGSIELEELIRRHLGRPEIPEESLEMPPSSLELVELARAQGREEAPSSLEAIPLEARRKGFWFRVNAELIIYGSTEPDARVSIGGRSIRLREDGTFSYRFALPDGNYELPVIAVSRDGDDARAADMRFARATNYLGGVGAHPQDAALKTPSPANL